MAELTNREKAIVHTMYFLMNDQSKHVPFETRLVALKVLLGARGIKFTEDELKDITQAVDKEQKDSIKEGFGFLAKHQDRLREASDGL